MSGDKPIRKAEEVPNSGHKFSNYFSNLTSYVPSALKTHLEWNAAQNVLDDRDKIVWASFDQLQLGDDSSRRCLLIAYSNGFQVWDVEDPTNTKEILSIRFKHNESPIKLLKLLPYVKEGEDQALMAKQPLIALSVLEPQGVARKISLYSMNTHENIKSIQFNNEIYSITCNKRVLAVALREQIFLFSLSGLKKIGVISTYPSPLNQGVFALGSRWIASPSKDPVLLHPANVPTVPVTQTGAAPPTLVNVAKDVASDVAKDLASSLYYLGDMGRKAVSSYIYDGAANGTDDETAGTIQVMDYIKQKRIAHFRASDQPIACLSFDPTGTLLATASIDGRYFNVYQITPTNNDHNSCRHLYTLQRGVTSAHILNISWSCDSLWVGVSSSHGTTHIYAVRPCGGPVNIYSHTNTPKPTEDLLDDEYDESYQGKPITLSVFARIKQSLLPESETNKNIALKPAIDVAFVRHPQSNSHRVLVASQLGNLLLSQLEPHGPQQTVQKGVEVDPTTLFLSISPLGEWNINRKRDWPEVKLPMNMLPTTQKHPEPMVSQEARWLSNVEITTHNPHFRPLWAGPQFIFLTYKTNPSEAKKVVVSKPIAPEIVVAAEDSKGRMVGKVKTPSVEFEDERPNLISWETPTVKSENSAIKEAMSTPLPIVSNRSDDDGMYRNNKNSWSSSPQEAEEILLPNRNKKKLPNGATNGPSTGTNLLTPTPSFTTSSSSSSSSSSGSSASSKSQFSLSSALQNDTGFAVTTKPAPKMSVFADSGKGKEPEDLSPAFNALQFAPKEQNGRKEKEPEKETIKEQEKKKEPEKETIKEQEKKKEPVKETPIKQSDAIEEELTMNAINVDLNDIDNFVGDEFPNGNEIAQEVIIKPKPKPQSNVNSSASNSTSSSSKKKGQRRK